MTFPLLSNTYVDPELVTSANLYSRVLAVINMLGGFLYGEDDGLVSDTVTVSAASTDFIVPATTVTFTLSQQRRVRVVVSCRYQAATAPATFNTIATYVAGGSATLTGAVKLGQAGAAQMQVINTSGAGSDAAYHEHSVLLAAGTYTAFPVVRRAAGGSATDTAFLGYCAVYDAGNA